MDPIPHPALTEANLPLLAERLAVPAYDRRHVTSGLLHIGVGGFNRSHLAVYLDDLLAQSAVRQVDLCWAECGIGLRAPDQRMRDVLQSQDYLYTVVERSGTARTGRIIGSICDYIYAPAAVEAAILRMASPECRIVSLTVTEGGYFTNHATGEFDADCPEIQHDLQQPDAPTSFAGLICAALDRRRLSGLPPFTVMSCDNLQGNGDITRAALCGFAELRNPELRRWIEQSVTCPNSMVDRITPSTTETERKLIEDLFGVRDGWPVVTEPFRQWVLEDLFCNGKPRWQEAGVIMTQQVEPYERMKMRLLNGTHFALAYLGTMLGFEFVHEVLEDARMHRFLTAYLDAASTTVEAPPQTDLAEYKAILLERFSNPTLRDQLQRICSEGSAKIGKFVLPVASDLLDMGADTRLISLVVASWIHSFRYRGTDGHLLAIEDAQSAGIRKLVQQGQSYPAPVFSLRSIFSERLAADAQFCNEVGSAMAALEQSGAAQVIDQTMTRLNG